MYVLDTHRQIVAISTLCEGMGIRAAARVVGAHRDTVMRLGRNVGEGYTRLHDELFIGLTPQFIEMDEAWSFV
jgi:transposase-like protein